MTLAARSLWSYGAWLASAIGPLAAILVIWVPEFTHYFPRGADVPEDLVKRELAREPRPGVADLEQFDISILEEWSEARVDAAAAAAAGGSLQLASGPAVPVDPQFSPEDLEAPASEAQLQVASLVPLDLLLRGCRAGRETECERATLWFRRWSQHEAATWLPRGLQWNDHSLASRTFVLVRYWRLMQARGELSEADARATLAALSAGVALLAKPDHYTYRTNHGFMQSLALLQFATFFPDLPLAGLARDTGFARIHAQLDVFSSAGGMVLEHSPGYHRFGVNLLSAAARYAALLRAPELPRLRARAERARERLVELYRPDLSLPTQGDTKSPVRPPYVLGTDLELERMVLPVATPPGHVLPDSGHAIWWNAPAQSADPAGASQTFIAWSSVRTRAHRHADDMSVVIWSGGREWLGGVGYWPYDSPQRDAAIGWCGSNAPHVDGEPAASSMARLRAYGTGDAIDFIDLERDLDGGGVVRRQVIRDGGTWVVLDSVAGARGAVGVQSCWTADPAASAQPVAPGMWLLAVPGAEALQLGFAGRVDVTAVRGSTQPWAGWTARRGLIEPAATLVAQLPAEGHAALVVQSAVAGRALAPTLEWSSAERWRLRFGDGRELSRDGASLRGGSMLALRAPPPDTAAAVQRADRQYAALQATLPGYNEGYLPYRARMSLVVLALLVAQLVVVAALFAWSRRHEARQRLREPFAWGAAASWCALCLWLAFSYFV